MKNISKKFVVQGMIQSQLIRSSISLHNDHLLTITLSSCLIMIPSSLVEILPLLIQMKVWTDGRVVSYTIIDAYPQNVHFLVTDE